MNIICLILIALTSVAPTITTDSDDVTAIKQTIVDAYVKGIHDGYDLEAFKAGFHEQFIMFVLRDGKVTHMTRDEWVKLIKPREEKPVVAYEIPMVNVEGDAATARIEITKNGKRIFTDFMMLYKIEGKWQIVAKIYNRH